MTDCSHHNGDVRANGAANGAYDGDIRRRGLIPYLRFYPGKTALHPGLRDLRGLDRSVVPHRPKRRHETRVAAEQSHQGGSMYPRERVPEGHVNSSERHSEQPLRSQQTEAAGA